DGEPATRKASDAEPFSALAFKILNDPFVGNLTFFRVYSGILNSGDTVYVPSKGKKERIGRLLQMHASERTEIKEVRAGDIAAAVGLKDVITGDTLCDLDKIITLEKMEFPAPVISVAVEPNEQGKGYEFINGVVGGSVPREYVPAVDKGIKEAVETGVIAGYPVVDVKVTLFDGSYHDVDSNEMAFKIAGSIGFKEGFRRARPVLLEPIMKVEVVTPEEYSGDVIGDLNRRRGQITGMDETPAGKAITADVPLSEMFGYATT